MNKYNVTGEALDFMPKFFLGMSIIVFVWAICLLLLLMG